MSNCACINSGRKKNKYIEKFSECNNDQPKWDPNDRYSYDYKHYIQPYLKPKIYSEMVSAPEIIYKKEVEDNILKNINNDQNFYRSEEVVIDSVPSIVRNIPASISCCICCLIIILIIKYFWR